MKLQIISIILTGIPLVAMIVFAILAIIQSVRDKEWGFLLFTLLFLMFFLGMFLSSIAFAD